MRISRYITKAFGIMSLVFAVAVVTNCEKPEDEDAEEETSDGDGSSQVTTGSGSNKNSKSKREAFLPRVDAIQLGTAGKSSGSSLVDDDTKCDHLSDMGIAGLALGGACHTSDLAANLMLGDSSDTTGVAGDTNGDGVTTCADLSDDGSGVLMHLLCGEFLGKFSEITSLAFEDDDGGDKEMAITFADITGDDLTAAGHWTQGDSSSFPANIGIFRGDSLEELGGFAGLSLSDLDNGSVYINVSEEDSDDDYPLYGQVDFATKSSTSSCKDSPSAANCHTQDIKLFFGEDQILDGPPNGFHLNILADDKVSPTFLAIEGRYDYITPHPNFSDNEAIEDSTQIYFQFVQEDDEMWMKIFFIDADGNTLTGSWLDIFSAGTCQTPGEESYSDCEGLTGSDYDDLWVGIDDFENITESPVSGLTYPDTPTEHGICTTEGCLNFDD